MAHDGMLLGERYRLEQRIAAGGMGEVWRARDETLGREVAVKLLKSELASDPAFLERFRGEARNTAMLSHPGIATVYDYGEMRGGDSGSAFLVMELVHGEPLSAVLSRRGRLSAEETLDIVAQTAAALAVAHRAGVIHRDIKPGNLLVAKHGSDATIKVTDFGIARATDAVPLTQTGTLLGTAWYLAPELAAGDEATPASDIYALGVVAHEALAGSRPFDGPTPVAVLLAHQRDEPRPLPSNAPPGVRELVGRMLARDPRDRPASAAELAGAAAALRQQLLSGRTQALPALTPTRTLPGPGRSERGGRTAVLPAGLVGAPPSARARPGPGRQDGPPRPRPVPVPPRGPAPRRGWSVRAPLIGLLVLLALVLLIALLSNRSGSGRSSATPSVRASAARTSAPSAASTTSAPSSSTASSAPSTPPGVSVDPASYIGRSLSQARSSLTGKGLAVSVSGSTAGDSLVTAVSPSGTVPAGSTVTVTTAAPVSSAPTPITPGSSSASAKGKKGKGDG